MTDRNATIVESSLYLAAVLVVVRQLTRRAHWTGQEDDPAAARHQFTELLPAIEKVLGPDTRVTLGSTPKPPRETDVLRARASIFLLL